jgi:hypothetical protein
MQGISFTAYGPPGLIDRLKKTEWVECYPEAENFREIGFWGFCLTRPLDSRCSLPIKIKIGCGRGKFEVCGWVPGSLSEIIPFSGARPRGWWYWPGHQYFGLFKEKLVPRPEKGKRTRYSVAISLWNGKE